MTSPYKINVDLPSCFPI